MKKSVFTILLIVMLVACVFTFTACDRYEVTLFGYKFYIGGNGESSSVVYDEDGNPVNPNFPSSEEGTPSGNSQTGQNPPTSQGGQKPPTSQGGQNPPTSQSQKPADSSTQGNTSTGGENIGGDIPHPVDNSYFVEGKGLSEMAYVVWKETNVASAEAYYKKTGASNYTKVDKELIRDIGGGKARVDILGLSAGTYDIKIVVGSAKKEFVCEKVSINSYDRSGYAHFGYTQGVGAYNDDGTLKKGVKVVYITEATKNTASGGVASALRSGNVCVRIIGRVTADTRKSASAWEEKYEKLNGIKDEKKSGKEGTTWGVIEVQNKNNITFEGVGVDAEIYQWGVSFKRCNSVEVRNLTFTNYPEDACELNGGSNGEMTKYGNYWIHNNVFNQGMRLFDDSDEGDKKHGDGAIDVKFCHNVTYSYNKVANCHKTGLVGGSDENQQKNITYHHNYFYKCQSRLPLGRQANMHYYNNYFESISGTCMSIRGNGYVFSEGNYFYKSKNPFEVKKGAVKSFNDKLDGCSGKQNQKTVTDRTAKVSNSCAFGSTFDTDSSKFYYDASKKVSKVRYLTNADQAKKDCQALAGVCKANK